jgi:ribulose kinase
VGLGMYPDFASAVNGMSRIGKTFYPIAENQKMYNELYNKVYQKMYPRLQPLYSQIQKITGYPRLN